jgi:hypothetical protein
MQTNCSKEIQSSSKIILSLLLIFFICCNKLAAQLPMIDPNDEQNQIVFSKDTKAENRQRLYKSLVSGINKNLSLPLADSTEENWMDAFYSMELLRYKSPWVESKVHEAFKGIEKKSGDFQKSLMELVYDSYPDVFEKEAVFLLDTTEDAKCFAACAEYILKKSRKDEMKVLKKILLRLHQYPDNNVLQALKAHILYDKATLPLLGDLLHHSFFPNAKIVFSFQRRNRNYPGITIIRDSAGNFVKDACGNIFSVHQLARSISNLPGYISNGNTPQGIFRMHGFDVSKSIFIGPTPNIQLTMPYETSVVHFMNDSTISDSVWTMEWYRELLPKSWKNYTPVYESFFAGMAGRTEIIAHGTTVDPSYYKGTTYYPLTPTLGCLCTKEIWSSADGRRMQSDQQKLVNALTKAGGADGYYIVIELNDEQRPVDINDVLPFLK